MSQKMTARKISALLGASLLVAASAANAGTITGWNLTNVTLAPPPYSLNVKYKNIIYTSAAKTATNGYLSWEESDVQAPGMKVVNLDDISPKKKCIMTSGYNPNDGTPKMCTDPVKTSKRWKVGGTNGQPIDIYFNVAPDTLTTFYDSMMKLTDADVRKWKGFQVQLGFMVNGGFTASKALDGLGFSDKNGKFLTTTTKVYSNEVLSALFAQGLAGAPDAEHPNPGYFDPLNRFKYDVTATEDLIDSVRLTTNYYALFGDWNNLAGVPHGYYYDNDANPDTDNLLMANCDGTFVVTDPVTGIGYCNGTWVTFRSQAGLDANGIPYPSDGVKKPVPADILAAWQSNSLYAPAVLEDLANLNLNYYIAVNKNSTKWPTPNQFVVRFIPKY